MVFELVLGRQLRVLPMMINMEEILCLEGCSCSVGSFCCDNGDDNWGNTGRGGSSGKDFAFFSWGSS